MPLIRCLPTRRYHVGVKKAAYSVHVLEHDSQRAELFNSALTEQNVEAAAEALVMLMTEGAKQTDMVKMHAPSRSMQKRQHWDPWFDSECRALKSHITNLQRRRIPTHELQTQFKRLVRQKQRAHFGQRLCNLNEAISHRDMREVFHLLREPPPL
jgi:hypothetical protein